MLKVRLSRQNGMYQVWLSYSKDNNANVHKPICMLMLRVHQLRMLVSQHFGFSIRAFRTWAILPSRRGVGKVEDGGDYCSECVSTARDVGGIWRDGDGSIRDFVRFHDASTDRCGRRYYAPDERDATKLFGWGFCGFEKKERHCCDSAQVLCHQYPPRQRAQCQAQVITLLLGERERILQPLWIPMWMTILPNNLTLFLPIFSFKKMNPSQRDYPLTFIIVPNNSWFYIHYIHVLSLNTTIILSSLIFLIQFFLLAYIIKLHLHSVAFILRKAFLDVMYY